jgi:uncharacterized protein YkwD
VGLRHYVMRLPVRVLFAAAVLLSPPALGLDAPRPRRRCPPAVQMPPSWPDEWEDLEKDAVALINRTRGQGATCRGRRHRPVPDLDVDKRLREAARRQTRYMATHDEWGHDVGGCDAFTWIDEAGYRGTKMGQNLGRRRGRNSAALAVSSWLASGKGHCEALMDPKWRSMGVAYVRSGRDHFWTVDFGDR